MPPIICAYLQERGGALAGAAQRQALEVLAEEQENLHAAWQAAVEAQQWELVADALAALHEFFQVRSSWEGQALLVMAANGLAASGAAAPDEPPRMDERGTGTGRALRTPRAEDGLALLRRRAPRGRGACLHLGVAAQRLTWRRQASAQARRLNLAVDAAFALCLLGQIAGWHGERQRRGVISRRVWLSAVPPATGPARQMRCTSWRKCPAPWVIMLGRTATPRKASLSAASWAGLTWIGYALDVLGWVTLCLGDYAACTDPLRQLAPVSPDSGDRLGTALALGGLGSVEWAHGGERLPQAAAYMAESLQPVPRHRPSPPCRQPAVVSGANCD